MRRALFVLLFAGVLGASLAGGAAAWLLYTEAGLTWMFSRVQRAVGSALQIDRAGGTLAGGVTVQRARYVDGTNTIEARDLSVKVSPRSLLVLAPRITVFRCEELIIDVTPGDAPPRPPVTLVPPVPIQIDDARFARVIVGKGDAPFVITDMTLVYEGDAAAHQLRALSLAVGGLGVKGTATVGAVKPFRVEAVIAAQSATHPAAQVASYPGWDT